ncbi:SMP-30/gluconolactonase/LRE family protein [Parvularcula sp. LCG005]|uniref:SMP-30/gluconolactonase/LRE family protein n=1 Tax=Parvularcula sp. LCG005 TaxID=3078805 RepID=UPI0029431C7C|nr:SMP-30/gluconolactonase/LRE family protein [Parvularcula sp. LCG005]WOI52417.1 SMP-30/gluconolactonase/LRE family protein [Parvularcula sp. LCG005]
MSMKTVSLVALLAMTSACGGATEPDIETSSITDETMMQEEAAPVATPPKDDAKEALSKIQSQTRPGVVVLDPAGTGLFPEGATVEKLTDAQFKWSEGPVWIKDGNYLLFTDVPENTMYRWTESEGISTFLKPSGLANPPSGVFREAGANGLIAGRKPGTILMGDHGNRAIAELDLATKKKTFLVRFFEGKSLNSPNDLVLASNGSIYFTDPPYGLEGGDESTVKELPFNAVYRFVAESLEGQPLLEVVDESLTRPNGVILSPDEESLFVTVSDPESAMVYRYPLSDDGMPLGRETIWDATPMVQAGLAGLPDGMAMAKDGTLFTTGPGGVHVFDKDGKHLAVIVTGSAAANCTFGGPDGKTLYITSGAFLARIKTNLTGVGF